MQIPLSFTLVDVREFEIILEEGGRCFAIIRRPYAGRSRAEANLVGFAGTPEAGA